MYHKASPISKPHSDDSSQIQSQKQQQENQPQTNPMVQLHQAVGNQAMGKLIQAKSEIIPPNHPSEREADKVAKSVTQFLNQHRSTQVKPSVDTDLEAIPTDNQFSNPQPIQRKSTNLGALGNTDIGKGIKQAQGKGKPLDDNIKAPMEQALGTDFSGVRIHDNSQGNNLSSSIQAQAFTTGQDIFFKQGFYQPNSTSGKELLAHELTHVAQQQGQPLIQRRLLDQNQTEIVNKTKLWEALTGTQDISGSFSENSSVLDYIWQRGKDKDYNWQEITGTLLSSARGEFPQSVYLDFNDFDDESIDDSFWDSDPLLNETVRQNSTTELEEEKVISSEIQVPLSSPPLLDTQSESEQKRQDPDTELKTPDQIQSMDMRGFYDYQKTLQEDAYQEGNGHKYRHQVITAGYEFEFAAMANDSPLSGLDHFEVAEAKKQGSKIPLEKIGFTLETDAGSELEMVTPPFLIQTVPDLDKPIPDPDVVDIIETNITNELQGIVNDHYPNDKTLTIASFANKFKTNTGIDFEFENQQVKPEHLAGGATKTSGTITAKELKAIGMGKSWKHGWGTIDAQVNFASDAEFYNLIQDMDYDTNEVLGQGLFGEIVRFYKDLTDYFAEDFLKQFESVTSKAPDYKMTRFLKEIANIFANQIGVIAQEKWLKGQKKVNQLSSVTIETIGEGKYSVYENMMSLVKDQYPVWRKDTLMNYGLGMFEEDEWQQWNDLLKFLADKNNNNYWSNLYQASLQKINNIADSLTSDETLKDRIKKMVKEGKFFNAEYKEYYDSVRSQLKKQIRENKLHLPKVKGTTMRQKDYQDMDLSPQQRGELYHHDKQWLTPRQDTLIRGSHVQMPEIWGDKRLHVLEVRRDNSMLRKAVEKMREMEEKKQN